MWSCDLYIQPVLLVTKVPTGLSAGKVAGGDVHLFIYLFYQDALKAGAHAIVKV